ncbi:MAG TPA: hypothetical protein VFJ06_08695 [Halococcus sp.]|nr:hypothetical protein [Halococcus sp.]
MDIWDSLDDFDRRDWHTTADGTVRFAMVTVTHSKDNPEGRV